MTTEFSDITDTFRLFPSTGIVEIEVLGEKGQRKRLRMPIRKLDKLGQTLIQLADLARNQAVESGYAWTLPAEDILSEATPVTHWRTVSVNGLVALQLGSPGDSLKVLSLSPERARQLSQDIRQQADEVDMRARPKN